MFTTSSTVSPPAQSTLRSAASCFPPPLFFLMSLSVRLTSHKFTPQTFKDHMIDGETLPLLSEEHLLDTLGLKLGPALKIRSQVGTDFRQSIRVKL